MKVSTTATTLLLGLAVAVGSATTSTADDKVTTTTKTTTYSGVVSQIDPNASTIILKSESSPSPVTYRYSKETSFVDASGNVVTYESIRNSPVRVEYDTDPAGQVIVRRVIQTGPPTVVVPSAPAAPSPGAGMMRQEKTVTHTEEDD
jgi:hypothetical protein